MRSGFALVKLQWRVKSEGEKRRTLPGAAANSEQMGQINGVSLTHGSYQNDTLICEMTN